MAAPGALAQHAVEQAVLSVAKRLEDQLDDQLHKLENLKDDDLERMRQKRIDDMRRQQEMSREWVARGHGSYTEVAEEKQVGPQPAARSVRHRPLRTHGAAARVMACLRGASCCFVTHPPQRRRCGVPAPDPANPLPASPVPNNHPVLQGGQGRGARGRALLPRVQLAVQGDGQAPGAALPQAPGDQVLQGAAGVAGWRGLGWWAGCAPTSPCAPGWTTFKGCIADRLVVGADPASSSPARWRGLSLHPPGARPPPATNRSTRRRAPTSPKS